MEKQTWTNAGHRKYEIIIKILKIEMTLTYLSVS